MATQIPFGMYGTSRPAEAPRAKSLAELSGSAPVFGGRFGGQKVGAAFDPSTRWEVSLFPSRFFSHLSFSAGVSFRGLRILQAAPLMHSFFKLLGR